MAQQDNIILRLRPASGSAADIATAIAATEVAAVEQQTAVDHAKRARDDGLLDADPASLRKAEQALIEAREQCERIDAVLANLRTRHANAVEGETVARVADLKARTEESYRKLSVWWIGKRTKLAKELGEGIALLQQAEEAAAEHARAQVAGRHQLPRLAFDDYATVPPIDATAWPRELGDALKWLGSGSRDPVADAAGIAKLCDPRAQGQF